MVTRVTAIDCRTVWQELSNYIDKQVTPDLRERMEAHFRDCRHCTAILDGTRNVLTLVADGKTFSLPKGFSSRLYEKLEAAMK